ncbi:MAG TPA: ribose-phosphate pyrophosphokinase [Crocinitomix sp.]|nr:ribose-phosphate pyrophosphokinase [Bacteroidia bacterium]HIP35339.1 ribose-phosphate pyrophosphokinase [Crocinitomix sp.]
MILNLDNSFNPYPDKKVIAFESFTFSGGEPHIKILDDLTTTKEVFITHRIKSFNDIGLLLVAVNALRNMEVEKINLFMPYFPAARQDRLMVKGEALSVKVYAELINNLYLNSITIFDPHSEVTSALLNNCNVIENHQFIENVIKTLDKNTLLISPDGGALKKIYKVASYLQNYEVIECSKSRNVKTGKLSGFKVYTDDLQGKDCLIVDDICDGGGTFLGLAKELKAKNAGKLYLAVSHGIFSKGLEELSKEFEIIFTTNSFKGIETTNQVKQINISEII